MALLKNSNEKGPYSKLETPQNTLRTANKEKMEILEKYQAIFGDDNVFQYNILPILLSRPYLQIKIELFCDKQFEEILKKKSFAALDFPRIVHESMKSKFRETKSYFVQSLSNIVYSAEKYADNNEFSLFLEFCQKKGENQKLLFYLFLRQHFKILTYTSFLAHNKTAQDPSKITISLESALDIISVAFSHERTALGKLLDAFKTKYQKQTQISYYEFMMTCMGARFIYNDLPMLEKAVALYKVTNFNDLNNVFTQKNGNNPREGQELMDSGVYQRTLMSMPPNESFGNVPPRRSIASDDRGLETSRLRTNSVFRVDPVNRQFFENVKNEIKSFSDRLVEAHVDKLGLKMDMSGEQAVSASLQLQKKLYFVVKAVFGEDRKKFLGVLRSSIESGDHVLDFWMDLQDLLREIQRMGLINPKIAQDFLSRLCVFPVLKDHISFLMEFRFQRMEDVLDVELKI